MVSEENIFEISANQKQALLVEAMFVVQSGGNEESMVPFDPVVSEKKILEISANQKQELPMAAMFVV